MVHRNLRPAAEAEADVSHRLASLGEKRDELRGELSRRVAAAASAADVEARRMGVGPSVDGGGGGGEDVERDVAGLGEMSGEEVSALVTRLAALHGARDLLVAQLRVEGALQEAQGIITSAGLSSSSSSSSSASTAAVGGGGGGGGATAMLDKIEAGAAALATAARGLTAAAASNPSSSSSSSSLHASYKGANIDPNAKKVTRRTRGAARGAAAAAGGDPGEPRFTEAAVIRLARMAGDMRGPTANVLVDAAAATGWPPAINPTALVRVIIYFFGARVYEGVR